MLVPFYATKRFGLGHLENEDLVFGQFLFRNPVTRLDQGSFGGIEGSFCTGSSSARTRAGCSIDAGVASLVNNFEYVLRPIKRAKRAARRFAQPREIGISGEEYGTW